MKGKDWSLTEGKMSSRLGGEVALILYWLHQCLYRACNANNACVSQAFPYLLFFISSSGQCSCPSSMPSTTSLFAFCRSFPRINSDSGTLKKCQETKTKEKAFARTRRAARARLPPWIPFCGSSPAATCAGRRRAPRAAGTSAERGLPRRRPSHGTAPPGCLALPSCPPSAVRKHSACVHRHVAFAHAAPHQLQAWISCCAKLRRHSQSQQPP